MNSARIAEVQCQLRVRAYDRREELGAVLTWFLAEGVALRLAQHTNVRDQLLLSGDLMLHAQLAGEALDLSPTSSRSSCRYGACDLNR